MYANFRSKAYPCFDLIRLVHEHTSPDSDALGLRWFMARTFAFKLVFAKYFAAKEKKAREELEKLQESRHDVCAKRKTLCEYPRATRKAVLDAEPPEEESEDPKAGEEKPKEEPEIKGQSEDYLTDEEWADDKARWAQEEVKWDAEEEIERRLFDEREHEWYASWVDFQALTTEIEGFSDDVFIQLHGLANYGY
jgi:hypothetical protein